MKIKVHFRRSQKLQSQKGLLSSSTEVEVKPGGEVKTTSCLTSFEFDQLPGIQLYAFKDTVKEGEEYLLANMHLPNFLAGMDPLLTGINGLFLISLGGGSGNVMDNSCKARGRQGCPTRILMGPIKSFYFNGMHFYPMMMRDFSVAYYICDADSKEYDWQLKYGTEFDKLFAVAVDFPIVNDATLGIYQTRAAELVS